MKTKLLNRIGKNLEITLLACIPNCALQLLLFFVDIRASWKLIYKKELNQPNTFTQCSCQINSSHNITPTSPCPKFYSVYPMKMKHIIYINSST